jgi:hypothetical protein
MEGNKLLVRNQIPNAIPLLVLTTSVSVTLVCRLGVADVTQGLLDVVLYGTVASLILLFGVSVPSVALLRLAQRHRIPWWVAAAAGASGQILIHLALIAYGWVVFFHSIHVHSILTAHYAEFAASAMAMTIVFPIAVGPWYLTARLSRNPHAAMSIKPGLYTITAASLALTANHTFFFVFAWAGATLYLAASGIRSAVSYALILRAMRFRT